MGEVAQPRLVRALYNFKPKNTDELAFNKGDVITITQAEEGGWWEGTLQDKTAWFPSNYVKDIKDSRVGAKSPKPRESQAFYHNVVLESLIETERSLVTEQQSLLQHYLRPLHNANVISSSEYKQLLGNLQELSDLHQQLLSSLDDCAKKPLSQQRIGGVFIKYAPQLQNLYKAYCANHPKAVQVLQKCKDELSAYMEKAGAPSPGVLKLTTSLSLPFGRLEKYPNLLKEIERHTEQSHVDRGDTQRAISVYREIAASCADIRKQKELEFELMTTPIKGWEGEPMSSLGEVQLISHVLVHVENSEKRERLFVLLPGVLVMLSVGSHLSAYTYEGKLVTGGIVVSALEDSDTSPYSNAFQITGNLIDKRIVSCVSKTEQKQWLEMLRQQSKKAGPMTSHPIKVMPAKMKPKVKQLSQPAPPQIARVSSRAPPLSLYKLNGVWSTSCLLPCPPLRPTLRDDDGRSNKGSYRNKPVMEEQKALEEDSLILQVIEAYCTSAKARHTVNSSLLDSPQVLIAEEEKIIVEDLKGGIEEKSLVDTVYQLRDQVKELKQSQDQLRKEVEDGKRAHTRLENVVRKALKNSAESAHPVCNDHEGDAQTV